jgi:hypothetical protein
MTRWWFFASRRLLCPYTLVGDILFGKNDPSPPRPKKKNREGGGGGKKVMEWLWTRRLHYRRHPIRLFSPLQTTPTSFESETSFQSFL